MSGDVLVEWKPVDGIDGALKNTVIMVSFNVYRSSPQSTTLTSETQRQPSTVAELVVYPRHDPGILAYGQPLSIISLANAEQCIQGVVSWNDKPSKVGQDLSSKVEEDEKEVETDNTEETVDLRDRCLLLEVVDGRVLGKL